MAAAVWIEKRSAPEDVDLYHSASRILPRPSIGLHTSGFMRNRIHWIRVSQEIGSDVNSCVSLLWLIYDSPAINMLDSAVRRSRPAH